jgi:hypothetical protein
MGIRSTSLADRSVGHRCLLLNVMQVLSWRAIRYSGSFTMQPPTTGEVDSVRNSLQILRLAPVFCLMLFSLPPAQGQNEYGHPEVTWDIKHDVSLPLRNIKPVQPAPGPPQEKPLRLFHSGATIPQLADPAVQTSVAPSTASSITTGNNFDGLGVGFSGFTVNSAPPDTNGAAGSTQYVQWVNTSFAVFDKSTGSPLYGPAAGNTLWSGFGGLCQSDNDGDPIAQYDKLAGRWVMTQFAVTGGPPYYQCVAISQTSDATGSYYRYAFQFSNFNDYPKVGMWPDAYYFSFNMFQGNTFLGANVCAADRGAMLNGNAATIQCFQLSSSFGGLLPSDLDGFNPPPVGSPNYFLAFDSNGTSLDLWKFHVDFVTPSNSTLSGPTNITVAAFTPACNGGTCIPQPSTKQKLDSLGDRLMYRLAYRNFASYESLVVNHSVTTPSGNVGVRWYELRNPGGTPNVVQQSTWAPDSNYRWMGSVAMDGAGDMAIGYSVSSSSVFPSIRYAVRSVSDTPGTLQAESSIIAGSGSQLRNLSRWGDYSSMSIDPVDDCTFWYTTEYLKTSGTFNWSTHIASFKFQSCSTPTVSSISPTSGTVNGGTAVNITGTGFLAGVAVTFGSNAATNVNVVSSTSITATTPANAAGTVDVTVTNANGQSGTLTGGYTYLNPPPTVSSVSPNQGTTNGGTSVGISGTGFLAGATVTFGGTAATNIAIVSSTSITATTPAHSAGTADITVTNTDGQTGTLAGGYSYVSPTTVVRVNAGGPTYIDSRGQTWQADTGYMGGAAFSTTAAIAGTADPTLFQTERYGTSLQYSFSVPNGTYQVNLYFAEIWNGCFSVGCRVFNVLVQGTTVFSNLDVFAQAGADAALKKSTTASVSNGTLTISFANIAQNPIISAIEILSTTAGTISGTVTKASDNTAISGAMVSYSLGSATTDSNGFYTLADVPSGTYSVTASATGFQSSSQTNVSVTSGVTTTANFSLTASSTVVRVNAGGPAYIDSHGQTWQGDTGYNAGATFSTSSAIAGTPDPTLFQTERYGTPLQYSFSVPNGTYAVNLYFAEIWSGCFSVGCRVFNVQVQGTTVFSNLDVFAQAGANTALEKSTMASVTNGTLTISFGSVTQNPIISAIEVLQQ